MNISLRASMLPLVMVTALVFAKREINAKGLILSLLTIFLSNMVMSLQAEEYYWRSAANTSITGPSPEAACYSFFIWYRVYAQTSRHTYTYNRSEFENTSAYCYIDTYDSVHNQHSTYTSYIYRHGDKCSPEKNYNQTTGTCSQSEQKGVPEKRACIGNPINLSVGNKFQTELDYSTRGMSSLNLSRSYNSLDGLWRHSFSTYLRFAGTQYVSLVWHDGREAFFNITGTNISSTSADLGVLSKTSTGWLFVSADNERFTFDTTGKLTHWANNRGHSYQLAYSGSQITVTDNLGNTLTFTEDSDRQPLSLSAPGVQITYSYNANNRLTSVNRTTGGQTTQRHYHYEVPDKPDLLTGITDERGVRYATWTYDDQGRAISSEHADGADKVTVSYHTDGTVSVTNELGKVAKYSFQTIRGVRRITAVEGEPSPDCPSSNSTFTYDDRGLLKTKTDNKGILTTYDYNERGLEVSRTEASGTPQARTITTTWHSDWFLPVTITEPDRITQYTYDSQGRQTSQSVTQR